MAIDWLAEAQEFEAQEFETPIEEQYAPVQRGLLGDIGSRLARGVTRTAGLLGEGLEVAGLETPIASLADKATKKFDFLKPDIDEFVGNEGFISRGVKGGIESIVPSLSAGVPGALVGGAIGSAVPIVGTAAGSVIGAVLGTLGLFGLGTYGESKKEGLAAGLSDDEAHDFALRSALIEGGVEAGATGVEVITAGLGKAATMPLRRIVRELIKTGPKGIGKAYLKTAGVETATEVFQGVAEAQNRGEFGLPGLDPVSAGFESIVPALTMSFLFTSGATAYNNRQQNTILRALNSENPQDRVSAINLISKNLHKQDAEFGQAWDTVANEAIKSGTEIDVNADFVALGKEIKLAEEQLGTAEAAVEKINEEANKLQSAVESGVDPAAAVDQMYAEKARQKRDVILEEREEGIEKFKGIAKLSVLAANDSKNTEILKQMADLDGSNVPKEQKQKLQKVLEQQAEENTAKSEPMAQERFNEITQKIINETVTPEEQAEMDFEFQRRESLLPDEKKPTEVVKKPTAVAVSPETPKETEVIEPETEIPGVVAKESINVAQALQETVDQEIGVETIEGEEVGETRANRVGELKFTETAPGILEGKSGEIPIVLLKESAAKGAPYSVIIDGDTVASGLTLEAAAKRANKDTGAIKKEGKKTVEVTMGGMTARPIDPNKPKSRYMVSDKDGKLLKDKGLRNRAAAIRWMEEKQGLEVTPKQEQGKAGETKKKVTKKPKAVVTEVTKEGVTKLSEVVKEEPKETRVTLRRRKGKKTVRKETLKKTQEEAPVEATEDFTPSALKLLQDATEIKGVTGSIAKALLQTVPKSKLDKIKVVSGGVLKGSYYDPDTNQIHLTNASDKAKLHELVHAITAREMDGNPELLAKVERLHRTFKEAVLDKKIFTDDDIELLDDISVDDFIDARDDVEAGRFDPIDLASEPELAGLEEEPESEQFRRVFGKDNRSVAYALLNVDEFLGQAMTDTKTQEILKSIKVKNPQGRIKTLWDSFVNLVRNALGLPMSQWNALAETLTTVAELSKATPLERASVSRDITPTPDVPKKVKLSKAEELKKTDKILADTVTDPSIKDKAKDVGKDVGKLFKGAVQVLTEALRNISPVLRNMIVKMEGKISLKTKRDLNRVIPFIENFKKLSEVDQRRFTYGWLNMNNDQIREDYINPILRKNASLKRTFEAVQAVNRDLERAADRSGLLIQTVQNYAPRRVKDVEGLLGELDKEAKEKLDFEVKQARKRHEARNGKGSFTETDKQQLYANLMSNGRFYSVPKPGASFERTVTQVPRKAVQFYENVPETMIAHIYEMHESIEGRELIGKSNRPEQIRKLRVLGSRIANKKLRKGETLEGLKADYNELAGKIEDLETDMENSLAGTMDDLGLTADQKLKGIELIRSRLKQRGTHGSVQTLKNVGLMMTLGSPLSAITQLGDQAFNIFHNKADAFGGMAKALSRTRDGLASEFNFDAPLKEFSNTGSSKALDNILTWSGLKDMDMFGKESFLQANLEKWKKSSAEEFNAEWKGFFENPGQVHKDLQEGKITEDVNLLLFSELSEFQPISLSETPEFFLTSGNLRIFYMLKTFAIKAINSAVREFTIEWNKDTTTSRVKAVRNFTALVSLLALAGAGTDEIKDILLGRESSFTDNIMDNAMQLAFINRYSIDKGLRNGQLLETMVQGQLPPMRFGSDFIQDMLNAAKGEPSYRTLKNVPLAGSLVFARTPQGREATLKSERKRIQDDIRGTVDGGSMADVRKKINKFNKKARKSEGVEVISMDSIKRLRDNERKRQRE
jgi:hypothetical protein